MCPVRTENMVILVQNRRKILAVWGGSVYMLGHVCLQSGKQKEKNVF